MFRYIHLQIAALFLSAFAAAASAQSPWFGMYEFIEDGGKTAGGTGIVITHQIDVLKSDNGMVATLRSNGYQTAVDVLCFVKVNGNKAMFYFGGYAYGNMFENYSKGQLMLSLEQKGEKGKSETLTHWGAFKPTVPKNERSGKIYFTKVDSNKK